MNQTASPAAVDIALTLRSGASTMEEETPPVVLNHSDSDRGKRNRRDCPPFTIFYFAFHIPGSVPCRIGGVGIVLRAQRVECKMEVAGSFVGNKNFRMVATGEALFFAVLSGVICCSGASSRSTLISTGAVKIFTRDETITKFYIFA